jgi:anti-sigma factor RsiW
MKKTGTEHPEDFSPYLDGDRDDRRYEHIRDHLAACPECRRELQIWSSLDDLFRTPDTQIEVPPFQWSRIEAQLQSRQPVPTGWWRPLLQSHRFALSAALTVLLLVAVTLSGVGYRRHMESRDLAALSVFSESEIRRIESAGNPFRSLVVDRSDENPFSRFQIAENGNPFSIRQ